MKIAAASVDAYLDQLPEDRREAIEAIRRVILDNIDSPFEEGIQYGMVGYFLPHSVYPAGYHANPAEPLPFASIASQKNHIGLYLFCVYMDDEIQEWFREAWKASGRKLDMGKSCVRVKKLDDVPLDVLGELFARIDARSFVERYEAVRAGGEKKRNSGAKRRPVKKKSARKRAAKRARTSR